MQQYLDLGGPVDACAKATEGGLGGSGRKETGWVVTFNLQLGGVPDLGGWVAGHARKVARVTRVKARNAEEARIGVKGRNVGAQYGRQRLPILEPGDH